MLELLVTALITGGVRLLTGAQALWVGCEPADTQRIYFANHSSHLDFVLLWAALPARLRRRTRPVAAADYWGAGPVRRYLMQRVFASVLVDRVVPNRAHSPLAPMLEALDRGDSLIMFPEGTRGDGAELLPFKSGIFHLARCRPAVELVPVRIENLYRVMPKGSVLPVPLLCLAIFGKPARLELDEEKEIFLTRLRQSILDLGRS